MSIFKVAKSFQKKLIFASSTNFQNLKTVYHAALDLTSLKDLWLSGADPYSDDEKKISGILSNIKNTAIKGYNQVMQNGMAASGQSGYAGFLANMDNAVQALHNWTPSVPLDPSASNKLGALQRVLETAQSSFTPVGIPAQNVQVLPDTLIVGNKPSSPEGAAYQEAPEQREGLGWQYQMDEDK